jgi:hypothetical protein
MFKNLKLVLGICLIFGAWLLVITPSEAEKAPVFPGQIDYGKLTIYSDIQGSDIYVDAKFVGQDRAAISNIPEGKHYVRVVRNDVTIQSGLVDVKGGEETIIVAKPDVELSARMRKPNHVLIFGSMTSVGYNEVNPSGNFSLNYKPQYGVGTEVKFAIPVIDINLDLGFFLNYPSIITVGTGEAQMAISSPYICFGKDLFRSSSLKISAGGGFNYGIFNPGGGTQISIASRLGYIGYVEVFRAMAESQKLVVKGGYISYIGKSSTVAGPGDVTCSGYFLQVGMAYQL